MRLTEYAIIRIRQISASLPPCSILSTCLLNSFLALLIFAGLTPNTEISGTVGYNRASSCSKNPLVLVYSILKPCSVFTDQRSSIEKQMQSYYGAVFYMVLYIQPAHGVSVCDVIFICISRGTFPALPAMIRLFAYDCVMQLLTRLCLKAVVYFFLRLHSEEHNKSGLLTLELLFFVL